MTILHAIRTVDPAGGGPLEVVLQISRAWQNDGHHVETVSLDSADTALADGYPHALHALGTSPRTYGWSSKLIPWLRENASRFDAVIVHGLWQFHGRAVRDALHGTKTPYYVFPHGMLDPWFRKAYPVKHLKKALYWWAVEHKVLRDARAVLFTCEEERQLGRTTFRPYACREEIVVLGTSAPTGDPEQLRAVFFERFPNLRNQRLLLFLGRIHDKKGCDLLLKALRGMTHPWHLAIAGPCEDQQYYARLQKLAEGLPVTFAGMLTGGIKDGAVAAAEALILPSHQENFGMVVAEALASGLPVLISNKVNIWREVLDSGAGLVEPDTLEGTTRLLERWKTADQPTMRSAARTCFAEKFDIRMTANKLARLIRDHGTL